MGVLHTAWSSAGDLLSCEGGPVLLGGANSTHPVKDDAATAAQIEVLRGPIDAFAAKPVGECAG